VAPDVVVGLGILERHCRAARERDTVDDRRLRTLDLEAVYVGLGTEADFAPRDVKGKAVFIYGAPEPGLWTSSAIHDGALQRADQRGAAAVFLAIGLPGNMKMHAFRGAVKAPAYLIGFGDFVSVQQMIERAGSGPAPRITVALDVKTMPGLKTANVWGVIPGRSDEKVIVSAHRDGYFEGAADNASGLATLVGLAEYFTRLPKEKRPRTIMLVGTPGHHGTQDLGLKWIQEHRDTDLGTVALYMNGEHTAAGQTYLRGPVIRKANAANAFWWSLDGSLTLQSIVLNAYRTFGVATYAEPETGSPPGATGDYGDLATVGLVDAGMFYHTEGETEDTIPPFGLEASTRAFAKIIDESGKVEIAALKKAAATTRQYGQSLARRRPRPTLRQPATNPPLGRVLPSRPSAVDFQLTNRTEIRHDECGPTAAFPPGAGVSTDPLPENVVGLAAAEC
jgi:hypothetical protein